MYAMVIRPPWRPKGRRLRMKQHRFTISVKRPFSLKATVLSHGWHECAPVIWSEGGRCFELIERHRDTAFRISVVEAARRRKAVTLRATIEADNPDGAAVSHIRDMLFVTLGLDHDLSEFHALCCEHSALHVIPKIGAGRGLRSASMAENIVKMLCATNVNWTQAVKMINRIGQLGPSVPHFRNLNAWPTPREILRAGKRYLVEVCRVGYRAESILGFCHDVCDGRFDPDGLDAMAASDDVSSDEILARLRSIRGVGPATAHYLLSFLGRHDRLAIDSSTIAHVARVHTKGKRPTLKQIEKIYAPYGKWKNKVWWYEHWLTWDTARQILREAGLDGS